MTNTATFNQMLVPLLWLCVAACPGGTLQPTPAIAQATKSSARTGTGLALPRFVSLKSDRVPVRQGPGTDHKILWVFHRVGMPVEIIQEHDSWRQIRDSEGATGWVIATLLSARRTALVAPWQSGQPREPDRNRTVMLMRDKATDSRPIAVLEPGVVAGVRSCDGQWCHIAVRDYRGYVEQKSLWGVYASETIR